MGTRLPGRHDDDVLFRRRPQPAGRLRLVRQNSGGRTHAVGTRKPNPWGLYDRGGNVYQWCLDGYGPYASDAVTDPHDQGAADGRVLRGGSWHCTPKQCRSAFRWLAADGHYNNGGIRVCLLLE